MATSRGYCLYQRVRPSILTSLPLMMVTAWGEPGHNCAILGQHPIWGLRGYTYSPWAGQSMGKPSGVSSPPVRSHTKLSISVLLMGWPPLPTGTRHEAGVT